MHDPQDRCRSERDALYGAARCDAARYEWLRARVQKESGRRSGPLDCGPDLTAAAFPEDDPACGRRSYDAVL